jgi:dihydroorotase
MVNTNDEPAYDLGILGGTLLDPAQRVHGRCDIGFVSGTVAGLGPVIDARQCRSVIDATGKLVIPGLIDVHVHVFEGVSHYGVNADATCLARGATTVVDAGSAGADTFDGFRRYVIEASSTRILAHLNISTMGMISRRIGELDDIRWASVPRAIETIQRHRDVILGVKVRLTKDELVGRQAGLRPLFLAREAADAAGAMLMVHPQRSWASSLDQVLHLLRTGDILTHTYHGLEHGILDEDGRVRASVRAARDRGVAFDVGHGEGSFDWDVCERALRQDFAPTTISSDLHKYNVDGPVHDLVTTVSKFLLLGVPLEDAVRMVTADPASLIGRSAQLGTLSIGAAADAVVLDLQAGRFEFKDSNGAVRYGEQRLVPTAVVKDGIVHSSAGPCGCRQCRPPW